MPDFESGAFDHSATSPRKFRSCRASNYTCVFGGIRRLHNWMEARLPPALLGGQTYQIEVATTATVRSGNPVQWTFREIVAPPLSGTVSLQSAVP